MSRIGKLPVALPNGVDVTVADSTVHVKGPKGELSQTIAPKLVDVKVDGGTLTVERKGDSKPYRSTHGLTRTLIANMVVGVTDGWSKELEIIGVGYRAANGGPGVLDLALGFSHPVKFTAPEGVTFEVPLPTRVFVLGRKAGHTTLYALGAEGQQIAALDVEVRNPGEAVQKSVDLDPAAHDVQVKGTNSGLALEGTARAQLGHHRDPRRPPLHPSRRQQQQGRGRQARELRAPGQGRDEHREQAERQEAARVPGRPPAELDLGPRRA